MSRAGAIGLLFFWCSGGCVLDLAERGVVAVSATLPANTDLVTAEISAGASRLAFELPGRTEVTVPAGAVTVSGEARFGLQLLGRDVDTVEVGAGQTVEVVLDLRSLGSPDGGTPEDGGSDGGTPEDGGSDGGVREVRSPPIGAAVRMRTSGISGGTVQGEPEMSNESAFDNFRSQAQSELGSIAEIFAGGVSIELQPGASGVAALDDIFSGEVFASIVSEDESESEDIASGTVGAGAQDAQLAPIATADLSGFSGALTSGRFKLSLRGATMKTTGDNFDADVRTEVVWVAR